jgi:hypothetical protein
MMPVAALFVRADSVYKTMPDVDCYDAARDALRWPGGMPVVAHPPCRSWGRLRWAAKPLPGEKELAIRAVEMVRTWGGVLEHPAASLLWKVVPLPRPGPETDRWGGFSLAIEQRWWGHSCDKRTWLYVCGIARRDVPSFPLCLREATKVVTSSLYRCGDPRWKPHCSHAEREQTPPEFATWLVELARRAYPSPWP